MPNDSTDGMGGRPAPVEPPRRSNRTVTPAIAAALVVLAASFALSVAFVLANGGLDLPAAQRPSSSIGAVGATTTPTASAIPTSTAVAEASDASPVASPSGPAATATTGASAPATATPGTTPRPPSNRYDLLTACPGTQDCWIYIVRQGDNLFSIARYFGVPLNVVEERNPWTKTTQLVAGQKLLLPPPTR